MSRFAANSEIIMIISFQELIDILIMTSVVGFIFMDSFKTIRTTYYYGGFDWEAFKMSCIITAPALIAHELAHKFVASSFGLYATFHAAYTWLFLGVLMKYLGGFVFFVPGYVSITGGVLTPLTNFLTSFAGPALNGILYLVSRKLLETKNYSRKVMVILSMTKQINGFLFIFNILPIPGFDGFHVFTSLKQLLFGL